MLAKEFKTIGKQGLILLGVMLIASGFVFIERIFVPTAPTYFDAFFVFLQIGALSWAFFMGISMFSNETRQGGIEYLLTLPYSRYQLLALKAVPRVVAVILMFLFYQTVYHLGGIEVSLMGKLSFMAWYFTIFVLSLSLSTLAENFLRLCLSFFAASALLGGLLYAMVFGTLRMRSGGDLGITPMDLFMVGMDKTGYLNFTIYTLSFLVFPFLIAFVINFNKFDASYSREKRKGYYKVLLPVFLIGILLSFFTTYRNIKPDYRHYYLSHEMQLLEVDYFESTVYDGENKKTIEGFSRFAFPFLEDDRYIYDFNIIRNRGKRYAKVMRFNKKNLSVSSIYESVPSRIVGYRGWGWKNEIAFLEWGKNEQLTIVLVDRDNQRVRRINVEEIHKKNSRKPILIGADEFGGKEFFLLSVYAKPERNVVRVWADGSVESLNIKAKSPLYVNKMLLTPRLKRTLQFWQLSEDGVEMIKEVSADLRFYSFYWKSRLNLSGLDEVCGIMDRNLYRVDLKRLSVELISDSAAYPQMAAIIDGGIYYTKLSSPYFVKSLNRYNNGKNEAIKELNLNISKEKNHIRIYQSGFVLERDGNVSIYSLPDLKELHYKHLN